MGTVVLNVMEKDIMGRAESDSEDGLEEFEPDFDSEDGLA